MRVQLFFCLGQSIMDGPEDGDFVAATAACGVTVWVWARRHVGLSAQQLPYGSNLGTVVKRIIAYTPLLFFGFFLGYVELDSLPFFLPRLFLNFLPQQREFLVLDLAERTPRQV